MEVVFSYKRVSKVVKNITNISKHLQCVKLCGNQKSLNLNFKAHLRDVSHGIHINACSLSGKSMVFRKLEKTCQAAGLWLETLGANCLFIKLFCCFHRKRKKESKQGQYFVGSKFLLTFKSSNRLQLQAFILNWCLPLTHQFQTCVPTHIGSLLPVLLSSEHLHVSQLSQPHPLLPHSNKNNVTFLP